MQTLTLPTTPSEVRKLIRDGQLVQPTSGLAPGHVQANLAILPMDLAFDFLLFCQRNPKPCPLLEVVEAGDTEPAEFAPGADLRTDTPMYRVYEYGEMTAEVEDISEFWRDDLVSFLLGCSFSFETALMRAGIPIKHIDQDKTVSMFITNIPTASAGAFSGPMVVSMRAIKQEQVVRAVQVTSRFPATHGAPVHVGDPEVIGISDVSRPDFGDPTDFDDGDVPVFWACGVTPQAAAMSSRPPLMITHAPGHMFVTDKKDEDLAVL
jgi:uncharacterized protein YcsI (UPF0317 family)